MQNKVVYFLKYILRINFNVLIVKLLCVSVLSEKKRAIS